MDRDWYYSFGGVRRGPVSEEHLRKLIVEKTVKISNTLVWQAGMKDWVQLSELALFQNSIALTEQLELESKNTALSESRMSLNEALSERELRNKPPQSTQVVSLVIKTIGWLIVAVFYSLLCVLPVSDAASLGGYTVLCLLSLGKLSGDISMQKRSKIGIYSLLGFILLLVVKHSLYSDGGWSRVFLGEELKFTTVYCVLSFAGPFLYVGHVYAFLLEALASWRITIK